MQPDAALDMLLRNYVKQSYAGDLVSKKLSFQQAAMRATRPAEKQRNKATIQLAFVVTVCPQTKPGH